MDLASAQQVWDAALGELQLQVTRANFKTWLQQTSGLGHEDDRFVIGVPSIFAREWLAKRWQPLIKRTLGRLLGREVEVEFRIPSAEPEAAPALREARVQPNLLNPRYIFDTFIVGEGNRLAYNAILAIAERPGQTYNPLFLYGMPGIGKTHLLHALAHRAAQAGLNTLYASSEQLTHDFVTAVRRRATEELRLRYRQVDLLLVDDVHFLGGKRQTQEFFFHAFNELYDANRQIVLSSDRPPSALSLVEERLRSRFQWGLIADIHPPDQPTRLAILRLRARQLGVDMDTRVLDFIASRCQGSVRELEGHLHRVVAYVHLHQTPFSRKAAEAALAFEQDFPVEAAASGDDILAAVAGHFGVSLDQMRGPSRSRHLSRARQVAIYLLREQLGWPLERIGSELGGRDHSTVLYAYRRVEQALAHQPEVRNALAAIRHRWDLPTQVKAS